MIFSARLAFIGQPCASRGNFRVARNVTPRQRPILVAIMVEPRPAFELTGVRIHDTCIIRNKGACRKRKRRRTEESEDHQETRHPSKAGRIHVCRTAHTTSSVRRTPKTRPPHHSYAHTRVSLPHGRQQWGDSRLPRSHCLQRHHGPVEGNGFTRQLCRLSLSLRSVGEAFAMHGRYGAVR
jgi:hypothetical protein